ncbi:hypothetical protein [Flagellimonas beolgyonensis]|uniref:hypothetical protein n=1 Tax=Flagellimonas beolgyonensis TaxID=864064 RepID=UPI003D64F700
MARTRISYLLASLLHTLVRWQQQLPEGPVLDAFDKQFPRARYVTWQKWGADFWESSFLLPHGEHTAMFTIKGIWIWTRWYVPVSDIPHTIWCQVKPELPMESVVKVCCHQTSMGILYELWSKDGTNTFVAA